MLQTKILFIWDFDRTITDQDSDQESIKALNPSLLSSHLHNRELVKRLGWTSVMNEAFQSLIENDRYSSADITRAASRNVDIPSPTVKVFRSIASCGFAQNAIVSDSNISFITAILLHHDLDPIEYYFPAGIHTNRTNVSAGEFKVIPHHSDHSCQTCPPNLCKRKVVDSILETFSTRPVVVYIGDGSNDFCPVRQSLNHNDLALCRSGYSLQKLIEKHRPEIFATCMSWATAEQLELLLDDLLASA